MFFSSIDVYSCVSHNRIQSGKGVKYQVTILNTTLLQIGQVSNKERERRQFNT